MSEIVWSDFSTESMRVKATEYHLWHDHVRRVIQLTVNPGGLQVEIPEEEFLSIKTMDQRREFIAGKIRDLLAANENQAL